MRLGILGGTFDPIHLGHLVVAEEVRIRLELERVLFIPTGVPWLKAGRRISPGHHRLAMVRLAIASNPFFEASSLEVDRPGDSYSVDTVAELRRQYGQGAEIYFILGPDSLTQLPQWREPQVLLEMCTLVAVDRPGYPKVNMEALEEKLPGISRRVTLMGGPLISISGTEVRRRVAQGISVRYRVPEEVERYIHEHHLYRETDE